VKGKKGAANAKIKKIGGGGHMDSEHGATWPTGIKHVLLWII
jgi:hypothetical protein